MEPRNDQLGVTLTAYNEIFAVNDGLTKMAHGALQILERTTGDEAEAENACQLREELEGHMSMSYSLINAGSTDAPEDHTSGKQTGTD